VRGERFVQVLRAREGEVEEITGGGRGKTNEPRDKKKFTKRPWCTSQPKKLEKGGKKNKRTNSHLGEQWAKLKKETKGGGFGLNGWKERLGAHLISEIRGKKLLSGEKEKELNIISRFVEMQGK